MAIRDLTPDLAIRDLTPDPRNQRKVPVRDVGIYLGAKV